MDKNSHLAGELNNYNCLTVKRKFNLSRVTFITSKNIHESLFTTNSFPDTVKCKLSFFFLILLQRAPAYIADTPPTAKPS